MMRDIFDHDCARLTGCMWADKHHDHIARHDIRKDVHHMKRAVRHIAREIQHDIKNNLKD